MPTAIRRRFHAAVLLVGMVGVLEVFSLSALLAVFSVGLVGPGDGRATALREWLAALGAASPSSLLLTVALGAFVVKAGVILLVGRHSYRTAITAKKHFQDQLFHRFLHSTFRDLSKNRSSDWVRSITIDCNTLEGRFFMPVLVLFGEIVPALCVCGVLLLVNATAFFVAVGIFAAVGVSLYLATHRRLVRLGQVQQTAEGHIVQSAQQAFHGMRELTIYSLRDWAQRRFQAFTQTSSQAVDEALFISLFPRFVFEVAIYISLGVVVLLYAIQGIPLVQVAGEFAVFGAAAMRLLPSVSKVVSHLQSLKHARPAIVAVTQVLEAPWQAQVVSTPTTTEPLAFDTLSLQGASFAYAEHAVFRSLDLDLVAGDSLAIVGASGSGKSTLVNLLLGLLPPTQGRIVLNGRPLAGQEPAWWACIGYVPQEPFLMDASAIANVMLGSSSNAQVDTDRALQLLDRLGLPEDLMHSTQSIGEGGSRLSGGQRQRIAIARALYRRPLVLILDEATSAMDAQTQALVMEVVSTDMKGLTVVMITHRAETLAYCGKVLTLPDGQLELTGPRHA